MRMSIVTALLAGMALTPHPAAAAPPVNAVSSISAGAAQKAITLTSSKLRTGSVKQISRMDAKDDQKTAGRGVQQYSLVIVVERSSRVGTEHLLASQEKVGAGHSTGTAPPLLAQTMIATSRGPTVDQLRDYFVTSLVTSGAARMPAVANTA